MKKTITLMLALILSACLCACGSAKTPSDTETTDDPVDIPGIIEVIDPETADTEQIRLNYDKAVAYVESVACLSGVEAIPDDSDPAFLQCYWDLGEPVTDITFDNLFELDGNKVIIGETTIGEADDFGLDVSKYSDVAEPQDNISVNYEKKGKYFSLTVINDTEESIPLNDMTVCGFTTGSADTTLPFSYMGLSNDSTLEDAVSAIGALVSSVTVLTDYTSTSIELSAYRDIPGEGNTIISTSLDLSFAYDPDSNATVLNSTRMQVYSYEIEE